MVKEGLFEKLFGNYGDSSIGNLFLHPNLAYAGGNSSFKRESNNSSSKGLNAMAPVHAGVLKSYGSGGTYPGTVDSGAIDIPDYGIGEKVRDFGKTLGGLGKKLLGFGKRAIDTVGVGIEGIGRATSNVYDAAIGGAKSVWHPKSFGGTFAKWAGAVGVGTYFIFAPLVLSLKDVMQSENYFLAHSSSFSEEIISKNFSKILKKSGITKQSLNFDSTSLPVYFFCGNSSKKGGSGKGYLNFTIENLVDEGYVNNWGAETFTHEFYHKIYENLAPDEKRKFLVWAQDYLSRFDSFLKELSSLSNEKKFNGWRFFPPEFKDFSLVNPDFEEIYAYCGQYFANANFRESFNQGVLIGSQSYNDFLSFASPIFLRHYNPKGDILDLDKNVRLINSKAGFFPVLTSNFKNFFSLYPLKNLIF